MGRPAKGHDEWCRTQKECAGCVAEERLAGAADERAKIAAWLRTRPEKLEEKTKWPPESRDVVLARAIERGEYEKGGKE